MTTDLLEQALNPLTSPDEIRAMPKSRPIAKCLIRNPSTPMDVMRSLFTSFNWHAKDRVVMLAHPNLDPTSLDHLARRCFTGDILRGVASHPNTSPETLRTLWDRHRAGYGELISNPNTPWDIVQVIQRRLQLPKDRHHPNTKQWVRSIMSHPKAPYGQWTYFYHVSLAWGLTMRVFP